MKIGLDTSVVLRLITGEPESQAVRALHEFQRLAGAGSELLVSDLVVAEAYFALHHHYGVPKAEALRYLSLFLEQSGVTGMGVAGKVLSESPASRAKPGFVDRLIHAEYVDVGNAMMTFERSAARLPAVRVLPPDGSQDVAAVR